VNVTAITTLRLVTDQRHDFFFQVPAVRLHPAGMRALDLPALTLVTVFMPATGRLATAWAIAGDEGHWDACPTPWHRAVQLSAAVWRDLAPGTGPRSGEEVVITLPTERLPVRPARASRLINGDELGLHRDDARALGITEWAFVNYDGVPGAFRLHLSDDKRDRGIARLSYQARLLLGVPKPHHDILPELLIAPFPVDAKARHLLVGQPRWEIRRGPAMLRPLRRVAEWLEAGARFLLRAPEVVLQTAGAMPGEDQALTVRLAPALFPLLGTSPGQQVYVSWGPGNRALATALESSSSEPGHSGVNIHVIGKRPPTAPVAPPYAQLRVSAEIRASLGIPRVTVVTVRRRVTSLILGRLHQLLIPATGFFIALAAKVRLSGWQSMVAIVVIVTLLLAPLRLRGNPRGRIR
jgi:hypothetical protein